MELTIAPIKKIIKKAGGKRVSNKAAYKLAEVLEGKGIEICKKAEKLAKMDKRRTVMKKDIKLAAKT
jgi:histone H3/H4